MIFSSPKLIYRFLVLKGFVLNEGSGPRQIIGCPELTGGAAFFLLKYPVEIGHIIKAALVGNLINALGGIY